MITGVTARAAAKRAKTADLAVSGVTATTAVLRGGVPVTAPVTVSVERGVRAALMVRGTEVTVQDSTETGVPAVPRSTVTIVRAVASGPTATATSPAVAPTDPVIGATALPTTVTIAPAAVTGVTGPPPAVATVPVVTVRTVVSGGRSIVVSVLRMVVRI
ncbi:hypothetical protein, partial [Streptosporangium fragile]|uniref:hypothetical protein n=1 Tax=Streptosporangium fragile TaxID=46186 RepID=UPI0031E820D7